ncbi:MAG: nuclear transport factor 2 family protein [Pseudomonadota bacterium]
MSFKTLFTCLVVSLFLGGSAMANPAEISRSITDIAAGADRHEWKRVRNAFADTVTTDYSSLWGGEAVTQPSDELIAGWAAFLPGFEITHHMVTNHAITHMDQTTAKAQADFTATHRIGDELWTLGGRYSYELVKSGDRWIVTNMVMTALWETGDRGLVAKAAERAKAAN